MLWGKLIDHDRCIGCHACSVACKSENDVPLGSFRTWVKQTEKGEGLSARRHFGVLRCNQCENAPCVEICPTAAMHRRPDGIVDFESDICIGCKACIQACPYDAIYIDPGTNTAAKCNFCAHRLEAGLEPACVAACPTDSLLVSDLNDPTSIVARTIAREAVTVRKPELGTRPKVFYKGADESVLDPRAATRPAVGIWGNSRETELPEQRSGTGAPAAARVAYDAPRDGAPWGWKISAYMVTKAIASGALMVGGAALVFRGPYTLGLWPPVIGVLFLIATSLLLVADLKRPERFLLLLFRGQSKSWLVRGTYVILGAVIAALVWCALLAMPSKPPPGTWTAVGVANGIFGAAAAGYTAFLFGQARGRRLWQSALLLPHLVIQAVVAGCATLSFFPGLVMWLGFYEQIGPADAAPLLKTLGALMGVFLILNLIAILGELWSHGDEDSRYAVAWMQTGEQGTTLYMGVIALGHLFPLVALTAGLFAPGAELAVCLAGAAALVGLGLWDHLYVRAGQAPPLS